MCMRTTSMLELNSFEIFYNSVLLKGAIFFLLQDIHQNINQFIEIDCT